LKDYQGALENLKTNFMFLTKQCIHFDSSWTGQKDVERLSRSLGRSQDKFHVLDQTSIHFDNSWGLKHGKVCQTSNPKHAEIGHS
jgi:hypothetical protein